MFEHWFYKLIGLLPQGIAIVCLGTALVKEKYKVQKLIFTGLIIGFIAFLIQQLPLQYGIHIPLNIISIIIVLRWFLKMDILKSALAALVSFMIIILAELLSVSLLAKIMHLTMEELSESPESVKLLFGLPSLIFIIIVAAFAQARLHYGNK